LQINHLLQNDYVRHGKSAVSRQSGHFGFRRTGRRD